MVCSYCFLHLIMSKPHFRFIYLLLLLISFSSKAQVNLDSLWTVWNDKTQEDTNRLKAMHDIAWDGYLLAQSDSSYYFAQLEYDFAEYVNNKKYMSDALNVQGLSLLYLGDFAKSIDYFTKCLKIKKHGHHGILL